jgi:hypothetical protein
VAGIGIGSAILLIRVLDRIKKLSKATGKD